MASPVCKIKSCSYRKRTQMWQKKRERMALLRDRLYRSRSHHSRSFSDRSRVKPTNKKRSHRREPVQPKLRSLFRSPSRRTISSNRSNEQDHQKMRPLLCSLPCPSLTTRRCLSKCSRKQPPSNKTPILSLLRFFRRAYYQPAVWLLGKLLVMVMKPMSQQDRRIVNDGMAVRRARSFDKGTMQTRGVIFYNGF